MENSKGNFFGRKLKDLGNQTIDLIYNNLKGINVLRIASHLSNFSQKIKCIKSPYYKKSMLKKNVFIILAIFILYKASDAQKFDLALTPPMGWNSWNKFGCNVDEKLIKETADAMVSSGMKTAGYEYIVIDDCWQIGRDKDGNIMADPQRFPSGMKALSDYIHSKGLKFGLYTCAGEKTCAGRPGSRGHEYQDARSYAKWKIDYLKVDWCNNGNQNAEAAYTTMRNALYATGRPILLSLCEWGLNQPWLWADKVGQMWRSSNDIYDCWDCQVAGSKGWTIILDKQVGLSKYAGPGHWNDPDMLEVGNGGLTDIEYKSHFSLWCMIAAPLIAGNDLRAMTPAIKSILTNKDVIAIDQDSLGNQGFRYKVADGIEIWVKLLQNNEIAVCFFNRTNEIKNLNIDWSKQYFCDLNNDCKLIPVNENMIVRDVWTKKILGTFKDVLKTTIQPHDVLLTRLFNKK